MAISRRSITFAAAMLLAAALCTNAAYIDHFSTNERAIYFQTNAPAGNAIVAIPIDLGTGMLDTANMAMTPTGGKGMIALFMGQPAANDGLQSQGSVIVHNDLLFTVDAGSNTVSMWQIDPQNATKLTLIGKPQDTLGDFPTSVAYSPRSHTACVINGGARDGVTCFSVDGNGLTPMDKEPRPLGLNQTNPPSGPFSTATQVLFHPRGTVLLAIVKGDPSLGKPGQVILYKVSSKGKVSKDGVVNNITKVGGNVLFGSVFTSDPNALFVSDASIGGATLAIDPRKMSAHVKQFTVNGEKIPGIFNISGQAATCWSAYSTFSQDTYSTDAGKAIIYETDPLKPAEGVIQALHLADPTTANVTHLIDVDAGPRYLYTLAPAKGGVVAVDISGGKGSMVFKQVVKGLFPATVQGMAIGYYRVLLEGGRKLL